MHQSDKIGIKVRIFYAYAIIYNISTASQLLNRSPSTSSLTKTSPKYCLFLSDNNKTLTLYHPELDPWPVIFFQISAFVDILQKHLHTQK